MIISLIRVRLWGFMNLFHYQVSILVYSKYKLFCCDLFSHLFLYRVYCLNVHLGNFKIY